MCTRSVRPLPPWPGGVRVARAGTILSVVGVALVTSPRMVASQTAADSTAALARVDAYATAWNTHDPATLGTFFTDDADMVMGSGPRIRGREAIETAWERYFSRQEPSRRLTLDVRSLRLVATGVGIIDVVTTTGGRDAQGGALQARRARGTWVIVRPDDTWVVAAMRGLPTVRDSVVLGSFVEPAREDDVEAFEDPTGVRAFVETYEDALNARNPSALTALFTENGDIIVRNLPAVRGHRAIETWWREYFGDRAYWADPDFRVEFTVEHVRTLTPDAAVVDLVAGAERDGEALSRPTRETRATWVVVRREDEWRVAALRVLPSEHDRIIREHERAGS